MPVVVIVEEGTGRADANSYSSVVDADAYFLTRPRSTAWTALTEDGKAQHLIHATRILDGSMIWDGEPLSSTQALAFPRYPDDLSASVVPDPVIVALYELAIALVGSDLTAASSAAGVKKIVVGPIEIENEGASVPATIPRFVRDLVAPWGSTRSGSGSVRLSRA
jgi:hypothetical protein